jgi:predicted DNA-binding transcriptional regulator YafY
MMTRRARSLGRSGDRVGKAGQCRAANGTPHLHGAALRSLALAGQRGAPIATVATDATLRQLAETDPGGARLYRAVDVRRPAGYFWSDNPAAAEVILKIVHQAARAIRSVAFDYIDLEGEPCSRTVLPLALVYPPQRVKLLAWCQKAKGYRQFFVRSINGISARTWAFAPDRMALLRGLVDHHGA